MTKENIIKAFIEAWKPVFDEYPLLDKLPVYSWGRYYKYESAGSGFEKFPDESGLSSFKYDIYDKSFNWTLIKEIDDTHNQSGGKIWTGDWGDFSPNRKDMVNHWDFDDRRGMCVVIVRKGEDLDIEVIQCDSPE